MHISLFWGIKFQLKLKYSILLEQDPYFFRACSENSSSKFPNLTQLYLNCSPFAGHEDMLEVEV